MQENPGKKGNAGLITFLSIAVVLFALLFAVVTIIGGMPSFLANAGNKFFKTDKVTDDDFDKSIFAAVTQLSGRNSFGDATVADYLTYFCKASSVADLNSSFENHLRELWGEDNPPYTAQSGDFDNDGENEYLFALGSCGVWAKKINDRKSFGVFNEEEATIGSDKTVFLYCDIHSGVAVYQFFAAGGCTQNVMLCLWDCDRLNIETDSGNTSFFVCDAKTCLEDDYDGVLVSLEKFLERQGFSSIYDTNASLGGSDKRQAIFVYGSDNRYDAAVCILRRGRAIPVLRILPEDNKSLFLLYPDGDSRLLVYHNWQDGSNSCYEYQCFNFNSDYSLNITEENEVTGTAAADANRVTEFFEDFRSRIGDAYICVDPYQLTGYVTDFSFSDSESRNYKYLEIDNCDTSKSGIVDIKPEPDNWLNLRQGPAVSYNKVTVAGDFVKQACGSVVTVIDTVNTGDDDNPIWVKTQIKYGGETVIGYSSQKYISLDNIRHIETGERFTVTADTNDGGLVWQVNDTAVAQIDSSTGVITGLKRGLVMVTVTSASGLSDSCLLAVG